MDLIVDPYDFTNGSIADADQVDERFARLYNAINDRRHSYLQLLTAADLKVSTGTGTMNFSGTTLGQTGNLAHGLGVTPVFAVFVYSSSANELMTAYLQSANPTHIVFRGVSSAARVSLGGNWMAIG